MAIWTPEEKDPEFDMTPMIDIVFLLIAFFMTLISFISAELIELKLPEAPEASIPEDPGERQYISIQEDGTLYFGAARITYEALPRVLTAARQETPSLKLFLRADGTTPHSFVNRAMNICAEAGIYDLIFGTSKD